MAEIIEEPVAPAVEISIPAEEPKEFVLPTVEFKYKIAILPNSTFILKDIASDEETVAHFHNIESILRG